MSMKTLIVMTTTVQLLTATVAIAQNGDPTAAGVARSGQTVVDANDARLGTVDRVNSDGSVQMIYAAHFVKLTADKFALVDGKVKVTMTKRDLAHMR